MTACGCKHGRRPPPPPPADHLGRLTDPIKSGRAGNRPGAGRGEQPPCRRLLGRRPGPAAPEYGVADAAPGAGCGDLRATATGVPSTSPRSGSPRRRTHRRLRRSARSRGQLHESHRFPLRRPGRHIGRPGRLGNLEGHRPDATAPSRRSAPNWPRSTATTWATASRNPWATTRSPGWPGPSTALLERLENAEDRMDPGVDPAAAVRRRRLPRAAHPRRRPSRATGGGSAASRGDRPERPAHALVV